MDKTHFHATITLQVKVIYALLSAFGLLVIALLDLYQEHLRFAAIAASFSLGLVMYAGYLLLRRNKLTSPIFERVLVGFLLAFTLLGMHQNTSVVHWVYFVPIYTYFLLPYRWASIALPIYSVVLVVLVINQYDIDVRFQILLTYAACYVFSFMYALVNERHNHRLTKIINTDPITQVYNEHQLEHDLNKEIVRADRQHTHLHVLAIAIPKSWQNLKVDDFEQKLSQLAERMRQVLRKYDTSYRLHNDNFVVLMPQTDTTEAQAVHQVLQQHLKEYGSVVGGLEQYLVEDDAESLLARVLKGVQHES